MISQQQKPTILIITELFPNVFNRFLGTFVFEQLRRLTTSYTIVVLTTHVTWSPKRPTLRQPRHYQIEGIEVISIPYYPWWITVPEMLHLQTKNKSFEKNKRCAAEIILTKAKELHRKHGFSLIHGHETYIGDEAIPVGNALGLPSIFTLHGLYEYHREGFGDAVMGHVIRNLERADKLIAVSRVAASSYQRSGQLASHFDIIPNGIEVRTAPAPSPKIKTLPGGLVLLSVGFLTQEKRFEQSVKTLRFLHDHSQKNIQLVLVGKGRQSTSLHRLVDHLGLRPFVTFLGEVPPAEMSEIYAASDILLHPSVVESFSMTCLEAMSFGKPVVCTNVIGLVEHLHPGEDAIVVPPDNQAAFDSAVLGLVRDVVERKHIGDAARRTAAELSWDNVINKVTEIYHELINR